MADNLICTGSIGKRDNSGKILKIWLSVWHMRPIMKLVLILSGNMNEALQQNLKQLVLKKGSEKYIFRYENGSEDMLLDALVCQAKNSKTNFDWFDAAVLSFKLTQSLITEADKLLNDPAPEAIEPLEF